MHHTVPCNTRMMRTTCFREIMDCNVAGGIVLCKVLFYALFRVISRRLKAMKGSRGKPVAGGPGVGKPFGPMREA
ncbi:hypothetical protein PT2222_110039 [Paraburkholderia tropica]